MRKALAIDIGGTKIYNTIVNEQGEIIAEIEKRHTPKTFDEIKKVLEEIVHEHILGASKGMPYSIMLTLGTGVGGGIILDNKLYKGKSGSAGEVHFKMRTDKHRKCTCGAWDCFEAYASGTGLKKTAEEISGNPDITTYDVIGNKTCPMMKQIFDKWQNDILAGLIGLADIFDPDIIVLSGSMAEFVDIDYLEKEANKEIVTQPFKVAKATTGNYSGMIGTALLALGGK